MALNLSKACPPLDALFLTKNDQIVWIKGEVHIRIQNTLSVKRIIVHFL